MLNLILETIMGSKRPKSAKMNPKEPLGPSKAQKSSFTKPIKNHWLFQDFWLLRPFRQPQDAQDGSQKTPKKSKTPKNRNPNLRPKNIKKIGTDF